MNCFMLKAISTNQEWVTFTMSDVPTPIQDGLFVLLMRPNSPILKLDSIRRGDFDTKLFEGDVVEEGEKRYLICYERGFYAIDSDYIVKSLDSFEEAKIVGDFDSADIGVPISFKKTLLFKYKNCIFKINDIIGGTENGIFINSLAEEIPFDRIQQDCCLSIAKKRVFLGDKFEDNTLAISYGQFRWKTNLGNLLPIQEVI